MRFHFLFLLITVPITACGPVERTSAITAQGGAASQMPAYLSTSVGRIDSEAEARQLVASVDGVIKHLYVKRGQHVRTGQILLSVDCAPQQAMARAKLADANRQDAVAATLLSGARQQEVAAAHQTVISAKAAQADAQDRFAKADALTAKGFVSRRELTARQTALSMADAELAKALAQSELVEAGPRLSEIRAARSAAQASSDEAKAASALAQQCDLVSPVDGEVLQIFRHEGEFSGGSQGMPLIAVGNLSKLIVRAEINDRDATRITMGQQADVWIEGEQPRWRGRISSLARIMGRRSARSLDPTDRFDRDTREVFVTFEGTPPPALVGLRVMVGVKP